MSLRRCEVCGGAEFHRLFAKDNHEFFRCNCCRLIRIDPQPTDAVLAGIYGSKYYDAWGVKTNGNRVLQLKKETFRRHVLGTVDLKQGARVLDCGAAFGALMEVAAERGLEPYGIELASEAAAEIERRLGPGRVFSGPFEKAVFPGLHAGAFDAVFMCDFIEHVRNPLATLQKAVDWLRPGGSLIVTTPDAASLSSRFMGAGWLHSKVEHLYYFNRHNLAMLFKRAGLTVTCQVRARKVLDLDYIRSQFNTYPRAVATPVINWLAWCAGHRLRRCQLSYSFGEMLLVGAREGVQ